MESFLSPKAVQDEIASIVRGSTCGTVSYVEDIGHMVCLNYDDAFHLTVSRR